MYSPSSPLETARLLLEARISFIPIEADGSKRPAEFLGKWTPFQYERPTLNHAERWFGSGDPLVGIGGIAGAVSGNLHIWDFDDFDVGKQIWFDLKKEDLALARALLVVQTPRPGLQMIARATVPVPGNQALAYRWVDDPDHPGRRKRDKLIETRGEHGYALFPGCPLECHPKHEPYTLLQGDLAHPATITEKQFDLITNFCRAYNEVVEAELIGSKQARKIIRSEPGLLLPGDDYNERGEPFADLLARHGGELVKPFRDGWLVRRPGKELGWSATLDTVAPGVLYVFTSGWPPFEMEKSYDQFGALTHLEYEGDFKVSTRALREQGYGDAASTIKKAPSLTPVTVTEVEPSVREGIEGLIYTGQGLVDAPIPRPEWLAEGLLVKGGVNMGVGWGKMGKSTLYHQLALTKAQGGFWLGRELKPGPVLYINWEDPLFLTKERLLQQSLGVIPSDNYRVMKSPYSLGISLNQLLSFLMEYIPREGIELVVYDPLGQAASWANENDNAEIGRTMRELGGVAEATRSCFLPVHHIRKPSDSRTFHLDFGYSGRGGGAIFAGCMSYMSLQSVDDAGGGPFVISYITKANNQGWRVQQLLRDEATMTWEAGLDWKAAEFQVERLRPPESDVFKKQTSPAVGRPTRLTAGAAGDRERLMQLIRVMEIQATRNANPAKLASVASLAKRSSLPESTVRDYLKRLISDGQIIEGSGRDENGYPCKQFSLPKETSGLG